MRSGWGKMVAVWTRALGADEGCIDSGICR